jgi:glc operon protein GlcG
MFRQTEKSGRGVVARATSLALAIALIQPVVIGAVARGQEALPRLPKVSSTIRDKAGLFGADAIAKAGGELESLERATGAATIIETIDTLKGEPADKVAVREAEQSGIHGVFILIAQKERKLEVLASRHFREALTEDHRLAIRKAFFEGFQHKDFNEGLRLGVAAIGKTLPAARRAEARTWMGTTAGASASTKSDSPLIVRNQVRLTLAGAQTILAGAEGKAREIGLNFNIAVVDDGGHLLAFERMDNARPASVYTAMSKAVTAATFRQPSGPIPAGSEHPDPLLNLGLEHAAAASGGKLTTLRGGLPIVVDGQVIGGVGVGGGSGEQDTQVARAGLLAFTDRLAAHAAGPALPSPAPADLRAKPVPAQDATIKRENGSFREGLPAGPR